MSIKSSQNYILNIWEKGTFIRALMHIFIDSKIYTVSYFDHIYNIYSQEQNIYIRQILNLFYLYWEIQHVFVSYSSYSY